jgi:hypothetical protein
MATSYRGMYRLGASAKPSYVQVTSPGGNSIPLSIEEYESRGVLPNWQELPTERQYKALWSVHKIEQGATVYINPADAEECVNRDWLETIGENGWQLTDAGKCLL